MRRVVLDEVRAELLRLSRQPGVTAAMLAHEIRNPLAAIGLNAELIESELGENLEVRSLCRAIQREVDRLSSLTEAVLAEVRSRPIDPTIEARIDELCTRLARRRFLDRLLGR